MCWSCIFEQNKNERQRVDISVITASQPDIISNGLSWSHLRLISEIWRRGFTFRFSLTAGRISGVIRIHFRFCRLHGRLRFRVNRIHRHNVRLKRVDLQHFFWLLEIEVFSQLCCFGTWIIIDVSVLDNKIAFEILWIWEIALVYREKSQITHLRVLPWTQLNSLRIIGSRSKILSGWASHNVFFSWKGRHQSILDIPKQSWRKRRFL